MNEDLEKKEQIIADIRAGKLAIENDGTVEQLNQVLMFIWPQYSRANGGVEYYEKSKAGGWLARNHITVPTIKATDLLAMMEEKEYPLTLDISQSEVIGSNNSEPLLDAIHSDTEGPETKIDIVGAIVRRVIETIPVDKANFEHIAQTGKINGSLYESLKRILRPLIENN